MNELNELKHILVVIAVIMPRLMATFALIPFLSSQSMPPLVKNSFLISLALVLFPVAEQQIPEQFGAALFMVVLVKEVLLGVTIGFVASVFFWIAESVGYFIDNQRGTTMASVFDPATGEQTSPLGSLLLQIVAVLFFVSGGFLMLLDLLFQTYKTWPIFAFFPSVGGDFALFFLQQADHLMRLTVVFAAPVIIAVFVAELGLGLINRFAPQLNVFFLAMPIKSAIASAMLIFYIYGLVHFFDDQLANFNVMFRHFKELFQ
jgi:type III secretion protein T